MELEPGVIFAIVAGAAMLLIVGTGVAIAGGLYTLDRTVRRVRTGAPTAYNPDPKPSAREVVPVVSPTPSPVSQMMAARGYADVEPTLALKHTKLGMWIFLSSEIVFFAGLIGTYLYFHLASQPQQITAHDLEHLSEMSSVFGLFSLSTVLLVSLNTFILLTSSFSVVLALDSLLENKRSRTAFWLAATLIMGGIFVMFQGVEWTNLLAAGVSPSASTFGTVFFVLTGFHGLHVIGGLVWILIFLLPRALRGTLRPENFSDVELFGLYWHFVDIVWIVLFTVIYLIQ